MREVSENGIIFVCPVRAGDNATATKVFANAPAFYRRARGFTREETVRVEKYSRVHTLPFLSRASLLAVFQLFSH